MFETIQEAEDETGLTLAEALEMTESVLSSRNTEGGEGAYERFVAIILRALSESKF